MTISYSCEVRSSVPQNNTLAIKLGLLHHF